MGRPGAVQEVGVGGVGGGPVVHSSLIYHLLLGVGGVGGGNYC